MEHLAEFVVLWLPTVGGFLTLVSIAIILYGFIGLAIDLWRDRRVDSSDEQ